MDHVDVPQIADDASPPDVVDAPSPAAAGLGFPVRSSVEKLHATLGELGDVEIDDPMQAALLALLGGFAPTIASMLPDDPAELDSLCLAGARWMLSMRSDDAWQPADLDELFLGADEPTP